MTDRGQVRGGGSRQEVIELAALGSHRANNVVLALPVERLDFGSKRSPLAAFDATLDDSATVAGLVACGWIAEWTVGGCRRHRGRRTGQPDVMTGSHDWQVLVDMNQDGAYPEVMWELADARVTDGGGITWQTHDRAEVVLRQPRVRTSVAVTPAASRSRRW